jgi:ribosomal protein S18 acetylase RimI-like enzyme
MRFTIRPATEEDMPEMLRLWREMMDFHARAEPRFRPRPTPVGEEAWELFVRRDILASEDWLALVAEAEGHLVGQIMGAVRDPVPVFEPGKFGYVTDIVVDPAARRSGVGRALFDALKAWFRQRGALNIQLQVAYNNPASQAFWRQMGCTDYMDTLWYDLEER